MPKRLLPRPWREVNKRGQILLILGFIWTVIGFSVYQHADPPGYQYLLFTDIPRELRAGAWIVTGLLAIAFAWRPRLIEHDGFGFTALYVMPAERAAIFFLGWADSVLDAPGFDTPGYDRGLIGAAVYLAIVALVMVCSTWPDPPLNPQYRRQRRRRGAIT